MHHFLRTSLAAALLLALGAAQAGTASNGMSLNGLSVNGLSVNGLDHNGSSKNGDPNRLAFNGTRADTPAPLHGVALQRIGIR